MGIGGLWHVQDQHDYLNSNTGPLDPSETWAVQFGWNGSDAAGSQANHSYTAPISARTWTGDSANQYLYVPAGTMGLYCLALTSTGWAPVATWHSTLATFRACGVFDSETKCVFAGATDGKVYKFDAATGTQLGTYTAGGGALNKQLKLVGNYVYAVGFDGKVHKIHKGTLVAAWVYDPTSTLVPVTVPISPSLGHGSTPVAYSPSRDCVIYATDDCYVRAIDNKTGTEKWRRKPTTLTPGLHSIGNPTGPITGNGSVVTVPINATGAGVLVGSVVVIVNSSIAGYNGAWVVASVSSTALTFSAAVTGSGTGATVGFVGAGAWDGGTTFERGHPVIAERHGYVLMQCQIPGSPYLQNVATGNQRGIAWLDQASMRSFLAANPSYQSLFVMSLDDGSAPSWTPNILYTYAEAVTRATDNTNTVTAQMPGLPVVKVWPNGDETIYTRGRLGGIQSSLGSITSLSQSGAVVTATVASTASIGTVGANPYRSICIIGAPNGYNGCWSVTVASATTFTYTANTTGLASSGAVGSYGWGPQDWRDDGHPVEMVLDSTTVAGLSAGQFRVVKMGRAWYSTDSTYTYINDENKQLTVWGGGTGTGSATVISSHPAAMEGAHLDDRSTTHAGTVVDPLPTTRGNRVINFDQYDTGTMPTTHVISTGLSQGRLYPTTALPPPAGRYWDSPGFALYYDTACSTYLPLPEVGPEEWLAANGIYGPSSFYVAGPYVVVEAAAGEILVLTHSATVPQTTVSNVTVLT